MLEQNAVSTTIPASITTSSDEAKEVEKRPPPPYRRIAVVGAGAGGLVATRAFLAEKKFDVIDVYEQRERAGGTWNYTAETVECPVPSTDPREDMREDVSAVYQDLETNIPHPLMQFPDHPFPSGLPLFPHHESVLSYLLSYASPINQLIKYNTRVTNISRSPDNSSWHLTSISNTPNSTPITNTYDAILLAPGHYSHPFLPSLPGLSTFPTSKISHSHSFRSPAQYRNKRVLVIGNSASGYDIALHLSPLVQPPLLQAIRTPSPISAPTLIKPLPALAGLRGPGTAIFADGSEEHDIDHIIFCTGYLYTLPFLSPPDHDVLITNGKRIAGLYHHVLAIHDPSIAVIGVPIKIVPFPLTHNQAGWVAGVWSGRISVPGKEEMRRWEKEEVVRRGGEARFEFLGFPHDVEYLDELAELGGGGEWRMKKWDKKERWVRKLTPEIKRRFGVKKREGVMVRRLRELGFVWDEENEVGRDIWEEEGEGVDK